MAEDRPKWASELGTTDETIMRFVALVEGLNLSPADLITKMVERVVEIDEQLLRYSLPPLNEWQTRDDLIVYAVEEGSDALPLDIRPTGFMWPDKLAFPWTAMECKAAVIGYEVRWRGEFDDFQEKLRGLWEMSDGYAFLKQT